MSTQWTSTTRSLSGNGVRPLGSQGVRPRFRIGTKKQQSFEIGTQKPEVAAAAQKEGAKPLPSLHSDLFAPVPEPTIKTGVLTMSMAVLNLMGK